MFEPCCKEREQASFVGEFVYLRDYDGWCFVEGPRRRVSILTRHLQGWRDIENHDGEFYVYLDCPFCGAELPRPADPQTWMPGEDCG